VKNRVPRARAAGGSTYPTPTSRALRSGIQSTILRTGRFGTNERAYSRHTSGAMQGQPMRAVFDAGSGSKEGVDFSRLKNGRHSD